MQRQLANVAILLASIITSGEAQQTEWPSADWKVVQPGEAGLDAFLLEEAKGYALSAGGSGMIIYQGKAVARWGDQRLKYDIKSATKSFGAAILGLAVKDRKIDLSSPANTYHPTLGIPPESNVKTGWLEKITIMHLATHTAGFDKRGGYEQLLFEPGTRWHYSDGAPNWLAECIALQYGCDLKDLLFERILTPIGIRHDDLEWRKNQYREHEIGGIPRREFGSGIHANVEALSRLGYLFLREGRWKDQELLTSDFVKELSNPVEPIVGLPEWDSSAHGNASDHYGLLWWNNADGTLAMVPRDAFWAWGLFDSLIVVIPSLDLVVVRGGEKNRKWNRIDGEDHYHVLEPFLNPIVAAANTAHKGDKPYQVDRKFPDAPYPDSTYITGITWAPAESIVRMAKGSDNWPLTWADDDHLYTAYGDGWGFQPFIEKKLSLGLARIEGGPYDFRGINVRSPSLEQVGQGHAGKKASGILMVDGVLYMWVRNAGNSQLIWSKDHGATWEWADWKLKSGFGAPTFLNFGRNYEGARDDYVYTYSHDSDSAYEAADTMVLARVPASRIENRNAYEFFQGFDSQGNPVWNWEINKRGPVFLHKGSCYRSGITYSPALKRYLWCQTLPQSEHPQGQRFQGGFGIYEAPEPWGPWSTVYFTRNWDVGPGESSSLPTKWMSADGKTMYLVFSGDDHFSVRKVNLNTR